MTSAARYFARIDEKSLNYANAKLQYGWTLELSGSKEDALLLAYQHAMTIPSAKGVVAAYVFASLGHWFHVRGDIRRAIENYKRSYDHDSTIGYSLILHACGLATILDAQKFPSTNPSKIDEVDAMFRRGLFYLHDSHSR
jgi:hypothetical protein